MGKKINKLFGKSSDKSLLSKDREQKIKKAFEMVKEELTDHRESINENTNEIQGNYEYMCRMESKIDKLSERIDELSMFIEQLTGKQTEEFEFTVSALTTKEQEVFVAIYVHEEGASYSQIARRTGLTENLVVCYITNLMTKGVPVAKRYLDNKVVISIDPEFKKVQTKHNILKINETVAQAVA